MKVPMFLSLSLYIYMCITTHCVYMCVYVYHVRLSRSPTLRQPRSRDQGLGVSDCFAPGEHRRCSSTTAVAASRTHTTQPNKHTQHDPASDSEDGGVQDHLQAALPEVQGQIPKRLPADRVQPQTETVGAASARRVGKHGGSTTTLGQLKGPTKTVRSTDGAEVVRPDCLGQTGPATTPPWATRRHRQHRSW
jgi:hypothetical protein